jgi:uracil-DNA glycosylase
MSRIILNALKGIKLPNVFNPWTDSDPLDIGNGPQERCRRLMAHFDVKPEFLLIGEAPGYRGCHFSGVPFTNEALLCDGSIPRIGRCQRITSRPTPWKEASATVVWEALYRAGIAEQVVMWNAFAFHPFEPGRPMSNRSPTRSEWIASLDILRNVVDHFRGARVVAVGNVANSALEKAGITFSLKVRHPSMGGVPEFRDGIAKLGK